MLREQSMNDDQLAGFLELCSALARPVQLEAENWLERSKKWRELVEALKAEDVQKSTVCGYAAMTTAFVFISTAKLEAQHSLAAVACALEAISLLVSPEQGLGAYLILQRRNARFEPGVCMEKVLFMCIIVAERTCPDEKSARRATAAEEEQLTACTACLAAHIHAATRPNADLPENISILSRSLAERLPVIMKGTFVAQVVHLCLHKCAQFRSPDIKRRGLEALRQLVGGMAQASDLWRAYFPGIFGGLYKLCKDPSSSAVLELSMEVLLLITAVVTDDRANERLLVQRGDMVADLMQKLQSSASNGDHPAEQALSMTQGQDETQSDVQRSRAPAIEQSEAWKSDLLQRLEKYLYPLLRNVSGYASATWRVKLALVRGLEQLLIRSKLFLQPLLNPLLGVLVGFGTDSNNDVCSAAIRAVENIRTAIGPSQWASVRSSMVTQLSELLEEAVALANATKTAQLEQALSTCIGLINTLQADIRLLMDMEANQTMSKVRHLLDIDPSALQLQPLELRSYTIHPAVSSRVIEVGYYTTPLKYASDASTERLLRALCYAFSSHIPIEQTAKYFISKLAPAAQMSRRQSRERKVLRLAKRSALMCAALAFMDGYKTQHIRATSGPNERGSALPTDARAVVLRLAVHVTQILNEEGKADSFELTCHTTTSQNLGLELLGACSALLAPDVHALMKATLYAVVEKVGSPSEATSQAATATLAQFALADSGKEIPVSVSKGMFDNFNRSITDLCEFCHDLNHQQLLAENMDYLVEQICLQLRPSMGGLGSKHRLPAVIAGVLRHVEGTVALPLLREVIAQTLQGVDFNYPSMTEDQMRSIVRLMEVMITHATTVKASEPLTKERAQLNALEEARQLLRAFVTGRAQQLLPAAESSLEANGGDGDDEDINPPATPSNQLILDILQRAAYFLSVPNLKIQVQVLDLMSKAMQGLAGQESVLLPAVHNYWSTVMSRLRAEAMLDRPTMLLPALLQFVGVLCELCGDFLSFKFREELWPLLWHIINSISGRQAHTAPKRKVTRSAALLQLEDPSSATPSSGNSGASQSSTVDDSGPMKDGFSAQTKVERALVSVLRKFVASPDCRPYVLPVVPAISVRLLSFLGSTHHAGVRAAVEQLFVDLMRLDPDYVWCLLHPITAITSQRERLDDRRDVQVAERLWMNAHADPRAINAQSHLNNSPLSIDLNAATFGAPASDLTAMRKDQILAFHVAAVFRQYSASPGGIYHHLRSLLQH